MANEGKGEHIWPMLTEKYHQSDVENPDHKDRVMMSFTRLVLKRLTRSIKADTLSVILPASLWTVAEPLVGGSNVHYKYENEEEVGATDASILMDAFRAKVTPEKLQFTLMKEVESTEASLTEILFNVVLKLTEKSLEHYRALFRRYEGLLSNEIQKNQALFVETLLSSWSHNEWKALLYMEKTMGFNMVLPSVILAQLAVDFKEQAASLEAHHFWFEIIHLTLKTAHTLILYNERELHRHGSSDL